MDKNEPRELEQICTEDGNPEFLRNVAGNEYCGLKMTKIDVSCPYRSPFMDINGCYRCMYREYTKELYDR